MRRRQLLLVIAVFSITGAQVRAGTLRKVADVIDPHFEAFYQQFDWLGPNRYIRITSSGSNGADGNLAYREYTIFDLEKRSFDTVRIPMEPFRKKFAEHHLVPELVHYDGHCLTFWVEVGRKELWAGQIDVHTSKLRFTRLGTRHKDRFFRPIGIDASESYFYYGFLDAEGQEPHRITSSMDLGRFKLRGGRVDWEYALRPPRRNRPLALREMILDHSGTQLAVIEYNDAAYERKLPVDIPQQVHVIDIPGKSVRSFPIPRTAYGYIFSRDSQYLFIGSWEEKKLLRINLAEGKIDRETRTPGNVNGLDLTPSGTSLMVFFTIRTQQTSFLEMRRTSDLAATFQAPVHMLYPDTDVLGDGWRTRDGKLWVNVLYDKNHVRKGVRLFSVPGEIDTTGKAFSKEDVIIARGILTAKRYAAGAGIEIAGKDEELGDPNRAFASIIVKPRGDIYLAGTAGEGTRPVVARLAQNGKLVWKRELPIPRVEEFVGTRVAVLDDGRVVTHIFDYYYPGGYPASRLVMFTGDGKQLWEHALGGTGGPGTPLPDTFDIIEGNIVLAGRIFRKKGVRESWRKVMTPAGKVVSETIRP